MGLRETGKRRAGDGNHMTLQINDKEGQRNEVVSGGHMGSREFLNVRETFTKFICK